ncbi:uncharacterized protein [Littorina saxatilis]|uniref:uncharacterized protein n=1 Tax=Littorina saxatilis TaxID=31220 RepID=UPI0038B46FBC
MQGAWFSHCLGDRKYVEGYDDPYRSCFVNSTSTVRWTVVNETGVTLHLGTCYGSDNCTTPYSSSDLEFTHYGSNISVQFYKISSEFSGEVTCQETLTDGTVLTDTCPLNVAPTPSQPTHNCSELNYIPETGVVPCVCTADYLGSPAGRLVWLLGNVTIATGDYGLTQLTFPSGHVSRQHDGMKVTCQLDWVQPINTAFTLHLRRKCTQKLLFSFSEGARFSNCQSDRKYVEGSESPYLDCYVNSTSTVRWTVVNETGATLHLGTCYWHGNCTTPYNSSDLSFTHYGSYINAQFNNIASEFSGEVTCQETLTDGTVLTDTCPLNVARKQEESTSISTVLIGVIIGGVVAFLLVVTIVVHVVIVYRRLQRPDSSRRERQEDVHDHSTLTPAGHYPAPDHNGVELGGLNLDLTNPSLDEQNERPLSDYDVISDEYPEIAENLAESSLPAEQPDYISLREDPADYLTPCSPHESSEDQNDSNYLTLYPPRPNGDGQEREDQTYLTPCSPHESREDKND